MVTELTGNRLHHPGAKSLYVGEGSSMAVTTMKQLGFFSSVSVVQMHRFEQRNVLYKDNSFDFLFSKDLGKVSVPTLLVLEGIFIGFDNLDGVICIIREASSNSVATTGLRNDLLSYGSGENGGGLEVVSLACGLVGGDTLMSYTPLSVTLLSSQAQDNEAAYQSLKNGMEKSQ
ncbi:hypothetical protein JHK87_001669 [Glycine soja]|nr:hypothetical protein JHK87_001669 [Glycine soja]